jgi:hypothetical protein
MEIPYGFCHCGCGESTTIVKRNDAWRGAVRGEPRRFIAQHHGRVQKHKRTKDRQTRGRISEIGSKPRELGR